MNSYQVIEKIAEGAYGVVLKCQHKATKEIVAIKKFKQTQDDHIVKKTSLREVKILNALKERDNVVLLKEAFLRKGRLHLVLEYMEQNLLQLIEENPDGVDPRLVQILVYQLVKAIAWCHQREIVHRDIKPENLLVNSGASYADHVLKLCDFGFARTLPEADAKGNFNEMTDYVATRWYRAPELLLGCTSYGKTVDLWAIACIMGELIDGQPLFPGESELDQLYIIQRSMGPLTAEQMETFHKNPRFVGDRLREIITRSRFPAGVEESLDSRYLGKIERHAMSFLKFMLRMDPADRPSSEECLNHPYFKDLRESDAEYQLLIAGMAANPKPVRRQKSQTRSRSRSGKRGSSSSSSSSSSQQPAAPSSVPAIVVSTAAASKAPSSHTSQAQDQRRNSGVALGPNWEAALNKELDSAPKNKKQRTKLHMGYAGGKLEKENHQYSFEPPPADHAMSGRETGRESSRAPDYKQYGGLNYNISSSSSNSHAVADKPASKTRSKNRKSAGKSTSGNSSQEDKWDVKMARFQYEQKYPETREKSRSKKSSSTSSSSSSSKKKHSHKKSQDLPWVANNSSDKQMFALVSKSKDNQASSSSSTHYGNSRKKSRSKKPSYGNAHMDELEHTSSVIRHAAVNQLHQGHWKEAKQSHASKASKSSNARGNFGGRLGGHTGIYAYGSTNTSAKLSSLYGQSNNAGNPRQASSNNGGFSFNISGNGYHNESKGRANWYHRK